MKVLGKDKLFVHKLDCFSTWCARPFFFFSIIKIFHNFQLPWLGIENGRWGFFNLDCNFLLSKETNLSFCQSAQHLTEFSFLSFWCLCWPIQNQTLTRNLLVGANPKGANSLGCSKILSQCHFFCLFYLIIFYHVNTHLWMIMMESIIVMV